MGPEVVNRNKDCEFYGDYVGRDKHVTNIMLFQDGEREFVVTHNANIKPVAYFTGRETELKELRQRIEEGRKSVLVSGMGGIGKTHICRKLFEEYLNKHAEDGNGTFRHIGYIEYSGDMDGSLQNGLKFKQQDSPENNREAAWRELEYLASDGKLLLFVDNVDKTLGADPGLQRLRGIPGAVVLTSRQAFFSDEFEPYRIGFLDMEQCKEIYEKIRYEGSRRKIGPEEVQDLEYIIENLAGRHTITVELLAHLARTKSWTVKKLRDELEQKGFRLAFHKNGELVNIQESYEKLYDLSELTEAEQNILEAFSVFPYIPLAAETCNQWLLADAGVSEDDDILMGLYQKGWLQFDWEQESYAMHPVFAQVICGKCKPTWKNHYDLIDECQRSLQIPQTGLVLECQKYIIFAEKIVKNIDMINCPKQAGIISDIANLFYRIAEYEKAEKQYERCLTFPFVDLEDSATTYCNLAEVYRVQGKYGEAKELHEIGIGFRKYYLGENHRATANSYNNLALLHMALGEYVEAEELFEKSARILEKVLGDNHPETVLVYANLAEVYRKLGKYEKSKKMSEKSLEIRKKVLGEDHPVTAKNYIYLARDYENQGKYGKAKELYEKSVRILEKVLGENHLDTLNNYNNLAGMYGKLGEYGKAKELYAKSLKIFESLFGENHPDTIVIYNNLAYIYLCMQQDDFNKALDCCFKAYNISILKLGLNHPDTQRVYNNMKNVYSAWNPEGNFEQWLEEKMKE